MSARDFADLIRLPAALTVPGDVWVGAACTGATSVRRSGAMPIGSVLLYWSGMALNDWADREVDASERPERVIPSGRMTPETVLVTAGLLGTAGVAVTMLAGGRRALLVSVPLTLLVGTYDLVAKDSPVGPFVMGGTRGLDVLLGATASPAEATVPAVAIAAHTVGVTLLSRGEVHGTSPSTAHAALAMTVTAASLVLGCEWLKASASWKHRWVATGFTVAYVARVGGAQARTTVSAPASQVRAATRTGIGGLTLLQAASLASRGRLAAAALVAGAGPAVASAARKMSPT